MKLLLVFVLVIAVVAVAADSKKTTTTKKPTTTTTKKTTTKTTTTTTTAAPEPTCESVYQEDCNMYYTCAGNGRAVLEKCREGYIYYEPLHVCLPGDRETCSLYHV
ncbi:uncharacterized protein LOC129757626 [Uranotaenia lowii]|uniref:uncharacterized protein LOC129757626 n=1 Tax=Uranotaenia lowii TaxID=190385 RepID=UPI00247920B4|nr:uncharacterized protein LOC129757626 [Uranotaenia lowii]